MLDGLTETEQVGAGGGGGVLVTVSVPLQLAVELPSLFATLSVYVVLVFGDTLTEPLGDVSVMPPLTHVRIAALLLLHETVALAP